MRCPQCGGDVEDGARFCHACGAGLGEGAGDGEETVIEAWDPRRAHGHADAVRVVGRNADANPVVVEMRFERAQDTVAGLCAARRQELWTLAKIVLGALVVAFIVHSNSGSDYPGMTELAENYAACFLASVFVVEIIRWMWRNGLIVIVFSLAFILVLLVFFLSVF